MTTAEYNFLMQRRGAPSVAAKPAPRRGRMNKWESDYAAHLALQKAAGMIHDFAFEKVRLRLADGAWYTPDFVVIAGGPVEFHEVKGFERSRDIVRFKVAGELYPLWRFVMVSKVDGAWRVTREAGAA